MPVKKILMWNGYFSYKLEQATMSLNPEWIKEILESFLFCMYLGSFTLPLHKAK